jgi:hypothetical protein
VILASVSGVLFLMLNIQTLRLVTFSNIGYSQRLSTSSKSSNKLDFQVQGCYSLVVGLYLLTALLHPTIFRLLTSAMGLIAHKVYVTLPYYNVKANTMKFISFIVLGWAGIALVVGSLVDSTATSFILVVFVSPLRGIAFGICPDRLDKLRACAGSKLKTTEILVECYASDLDFSQPKALKTSNSSETASISSAQVGLRQARSSISTRSFSASTPSTCQFEAGELTETGAEFGGVLLRRQAEESLEQKGIEE